MFKHKTILKHNSKCDVPTYKESTTPNIMPYEPYHVLRKSRGVRRRIEVVRFWLPGTGLFVCFCDVADIAELNKKAPARQRRADWIARSDGFAFHSRFAKID